MRIPVVCMGDTPEPFLTSCVPYLKFHLSFINTHYLILQNIKISIIETSFSL